ncbi:MAG TPA: methyltransferase [Bacteroidales bacterium]|jgi:tRNA1Val (adenine37-N6)-methyltransferase|nr:methyltransferase [Bacteroidales bacterium]HOS72477.1 methyltransferase [Bacteroidales bacterium]HQH24019.1 methyltransferase [Bacteroidales bacterium]HQJ82242.1 methyltransferase [Bacteroidales bacterium]
MASDFFSFKQFRIRQDRSIFKVGTDAVLLGAYADVNSARTILDIGTGTGLIAIMLAQRCEAEITAIEPDPCSFEQALSNVRQCSWSSRISVVNTELQNYYPGNEKFDLIVCNPPYFVDSLKNPDPRKASARHNVSLNRNDLLSGISRLLADNGRFQLILPLAEGNIFIEEAGYSGFYCYDILKIIPVPGAGIRRMILSFSRNRQETAENILTIEGGGQKGFTEEYKNLTKDFYLKF